MPELSDAFERRGFIAFSTEFANEHGSTPDAFSVWKHFRENRRAPPEQPAAPSVVEPVAWTPDLVRQAFDLPFISDDKATRLVGLFQRMCAHPPRAPLTPAEIEGLIERTHFDKRYVKHESDNVCLEWYRLGIRDSEAAHGIGRGTK